MSIKQRGKKTRNRKQRINIFEKSCFFLLLFKPDCKSSFNNNRKEHDFSKINKLSINCLP